VHSAGEVCYLRLPCYISLQSSTHRLIFTANCHNTHHKDDKVPLTGKVKFVPCCQRLTTKQLHCTPLPCPSCPIFFHYRAFIPEIQLQHLESAVIFSGSGKNPAAKSLVTVFFCFRPGFEPATFCVAIQRVTVQPSNFRVVVDSVAIQRVTVQPSNFRVLVDSVEYVFAYRC